MKNSAVDQTLYKHWLIDEMETIMIKCKKCRKKIPSGWTMAFKKIPQTDGTETIEAFHIVCSRNEFYLYEQVPHKMLIWIFVESSMDTIKRIFKQIKRYVKHMLWHGNH